MFIFSKINSFFSRFTGKLINDKVLIVFLSGPSGVGKTTIENMLINFNKEKWTKLRSTTTRKKRDDKTDEQSYNFISRNKFYKMVSNNDFFFHMKSSYSDDISYGFTVNDIKQATKKSNVIIVNVHASVMEIVKENLKKIGFFNSISLFILPPSLEELKNRIVKRNSEDKDSLKKRLNSAKQEISYSKYYDHEVVNKDLIKTVKRINTLINKHLKQIG